jgi:hypothetical protein
MIIEIATLAKPAFLRLPRDVRRAISTKAQEIAQGKTQGTWTTEVASFPFGRRVVLLFMFLWK